MLSQLKATRSLIALPKKFISSKKLYPSALEAIHDLQDGAAVNLGGFGICGLPENLISAMVEKDVKNLVCSSNNAGIQTWGLGLLLNKHQVAKMRSSYVGENKEFERQYLEGELELELIPQGTLAEKFRAAGAGIPAFFTPTGQGTWIEEGGFPTLYDKQGNVLKSTSPKEVRDFKGVPHVLEDAIYGDFSLVKGHIADEDGNVMFNKSARNFNPDVAKSGRVCIVEVEKIVPTGTLDPENIHLPACYVQRLVLGKDYKKPIEFLTLDQGGKFDIPGKGDQKIWRERIVRRAAQELRDGMYVNLGIGIPTLCSNYLPKDVNITLQSENGILGLGPFPKEGDQDPDLINAGKQSVTITPNASYFSSSESFAMIRGQHMDVSILGGLEVSAEGDLANWIIPKKMVKGMGGAMDLVNGARWLVCTMEHTSKGNLKILNKCNLPLTGKKVVDQLITELAVFSFPDNKIQLDEIATGVSLEDVRAVTECEFRVNDNLKEFGKW